MNSQTKGEKRKARQTMLRAKRKTHEKHMQQVHRRQWYAETYPAVVFREEHCVPTGFAQRIRSAASDVDFTGDQFTGQQRALLRAVKLQGIGETLKAWHQHTSTSPKYIELAVMQFAVDIGNVLFNLVPRQSLMEYVPFNSFAVAITGRQIEIRFQSLLKRSGPHGTIYYSRHKPKVRVDGRELIVGFTQHAVRQLCERTSPQGFQYARLAEVFELLSECQYYERADLSNGQLGFTVYDLLPQGPMRGVLELDGPLVLPGQQVEHDQYFRVGYFPAEVVGDCVVAKTFLCPGFRATPELQTLAHSHLPRAEKEELIRLAKDQAAQYLAGAAAIKLLRLYQDGGVPQMVRLSRDPYRPPELSPVE